MKKIFNHIKNIFNHITGFFKNVLLKPYFSSSFYKKIKPITDGIKSSFTRLKTLTSMQLKDKMNIKSNYKKKEIIFKIISPIIKFTVITVIIYFAFFAIEYLGLVSLIQGIPQNFATVIFTIMTLISIISCTYGLTNTLYYSKDNALLLTFPATKMNIFLSKLVVYFVYESIKNITYFLPFFIAYGIINSYIIGYYFWLIFILLIITMLIVILSAFLSIPFMYINNFIKQYKILEYSIITIIVGLLVYGIIVLIGFIPEDFDLIGTWGTTYWQIQDFITQFNNIFYPFTFLFIAIAGIRYGVSNTLFSSQQNAAIGYILLTIVVLLIIVFLLVKPLYFKIASSPFEYKKNQNKDVKVNKKHSALVTSIKKELLVMFRTRDKFIELITIVLGLPIAIYLLNTMYAAIDTRLMGANMAVAFNFLIVILIVITSNVSIASIYSRDGASSYLLKIMPKKYIEVLTFRLLLNAIMVTISLIATTIIMSLFFNYSILTFVLIFIILECIYIAHMLMSADLDIMNPQSKKYKTTGSDIFNPNELKSGIYGLILAVIFSLLIFFFVDENENAAFIKVLVFAIIFLALRVYLYINKIKVYYKELEQ